MNNKNKYKIRFMKSEDFDAIVKIDEGAMKASRVEYYKMRFEKFVQSKDYVPTSFVAEDENGTVVGFIMGEVYIGEYGISQEAATLDTIGVDPAYRHKGIGRQLINEFMEHLRTLGVKKLNTLVSESDSNLTHFFTMNKFSPSKTINLARDL